MLVLIPCLCPRVRPPPGPQQHHQVGLQRTDSLFAVRLDAGELFASKALRDRRRYFPPSGEGLSRFRGATLSQHAQFLVVFPLSGCAFRALHGWAAARVRGSARPRLAAAAALPACAALLCVQLVSAALGVAAIVAFFVFGSVFAICFYGDSRVR